MRYLVIAILLAASACQQNARQKEYRAVRATFDKACKLADAEQCAYLGWLHKAIRAWVRKGKPDDAGPIFRQACERGSANGCLGAKLVTRARKLWGKQCTKGDVIACRELLATTAEITQHKAATTVLEAACKKPDGDGRACAALSNALHKQDRPRWLELARTACARKYHPACARLGTRLYRGTKVASSKKQAVAMWTTSCAADHAPSCALLSLHNIIENKRGESNKLIRKATKIWKRDCRAANRDACDVQLRWLSHWGARKRCLSRDPAACMSLMSKLHPFATQRERLDFPRRGR